MYKLSILVPTYNRCDYLQYTLQALLPQAERHPDEVELVICNNASTDGTEKYVKRMMQEKPYIRYHSFTDFVEICQSFSRSIDISPGEQYLDMVHVSDICTAYLKAYELLVKRTEPTNEVYGVYTERKIQLKEMILLFQQILDKPIRVNIGGKPYKKREIMSPFDKYPVIPGWEAKIFLEEELKLLL